jgi:hypothetical protein
MSILSPFLVAAAIQYFACTLSKRVFLKLLPEIIAAIACVCAAVLLFGVVRFPVSPGDMYDMGFELGLLGMSVAAPAMAGVAAGWIIYGVVCAVRRGRKV